jgi:hypothetical protein
MIARILGPGAVETFRERTPFLLALRCNGLEHEG